MDRKFGRDAARAHRTEVVAERKEARLHTQAVNAVLHGRLGKAASLEHRANNQAIRAERAHHREQVATLAAINAHAVRSHHRHRHPHRQPHPHYRPGVPVVAQFCNPTPVCVTTRHPTGNITVTQTTYSTLQPTAYPVPYPVGIQQPPPYNPAYPEGPPPPYTK